MGSVAFDAAASATSGGGATVSFSHTAAAGAYVLVGVVGGGPVSISSVTYGGTNMTLLAGPTALSSPYGPSALYGLGPLAGGTSTVTATMSTTGQSCAGAMSYTNVSSVGSAQSQVTSPGSLSQTVTDSGAGGMVAQFFYVESAFSDAAMTPSGGTNRINIHTVGTGMSALSGSDATSTTTFTATTGGGFGALGLGVAMASGDVTVTPTTATVAISVGTPGIGVSAALVPAPATISLSTGTSVLLPGTAYFPTTASITATGGSAPTLTVTTNFIATPAGATVTITGATPSAGQGQALYSPGGCAIVLYSGGTPSITYTTVAVPPTQAIQTAPDWALLVPNAPWIHTRPKTPLPNVAQLRLVEQQLTALRKELISWIWQEFITAVKGFFQPEISALSQLQTWAAGLATTIEQDLNQLLSALGLPDIPTLAQFLQTASDSAAKFEKITAGDINAAVSFLESLIPAGVLTTFMKIRAELLPSLSIGSLSTTTPNLITGFSSAGVIDGQGIWSFDPTQGHGSDGAVTVTANGIEADLFSIAVSADSSQTLNESVWVMWAAVTASGSSFELRAQAYDVNDAPVGIAVILDNITNPAASSTWTELSGSYSPPTGTDTVRLEIAVTANTAAGQVWFSDPSMTKTTLIAPRSVSGVGGLATLEETIQRTWNTLVSNFQQAPVSVDAIITDVENSLGNLMSTINNVGDNPAIQALTTQINALAGAFPIHWNIGGASAETTIPLTSLGSGSTPTNFAVTSTAATIGFIRIGTTSTKTVVEWHGAGTAGITGMFISIYKMNVNTGDLTRIYASTNVVSSVGAGWSWNQHTLSTSIPVLAGEVYGIELAITGSGTHTIAGAIPTWMIDYPAGYPKRLAATRGAGSAPASIASASVTYSNNVPVFMYAASAAALPTVNVAPQRSQYLTVGVFTLNIQPWAVYLDIVGCSAGGGGGGGNGTVASGLPGNAGSWAGETITRGVDIPWDITQLTITVGAGGVAGTNTSGTTSNPGGAGSSLQVAAVGYAWSMSIGGGAGGGNFIGWNTTPTFATGPGNSTFAGVTYYGGAGGANATRTGMAGSPGGSPGGGGGGGDGGGTWPHSGGVGGKGGDGAAYITQRQT